MRGHASFVSAPIDRLEMFNAYIGRKIGEKYEVTHEDFLGKGADATVYRGIDVNTKMDVAIKVIERDMVEDRPAKIKQLVREFNISGKLKHENIVNLLDVVFEDEFVMLVMEMASGGSGYDLVATGVPLEEERARRLFKQMVSAMDYCHTRKIYHRDLKLENIVMTTKGGDHVKITDFGMSKDASTDSMPKTKVGTIAYMAPEVTNIGKVDEAKQYGGAADIWGLGVIVYVMMACQYPFGFDGPRKFGGSPAHVVYKKIREGAVEYPKTFSAEVIEMLRGMFTTDPGKRWTTAHIKECAWFKLGEVYEPKPLSSGPIPEVKWPEKTHIERTESFGDALAFCDDMGGDTLDGMEFTTEVHSYGLSIGKKHSDSATAADGGMDTSVALSEDYAEVDALNDDMGGLILDDMGGCGLDDSTLGGDGFCELELNDELNDEFY